MAAVDSQLVSDLLDVGAGAGNKGRALEDLGELLFTAIPGVSLVAKRSMDAPRAQEFDLVLRNEQANGGLPHLPYVLYLESKNWANAVGPGEVAWFATKIRERNGTFGVMLVRERLSGMKTLNPSGAYFQLLMELEKGCELVILTEPEIRKLRSGETLARLLMKKLEELKSSRRLYEGTDEDLAEPTLRLRVGLREAIRASRTDVIREFLNELGMRAARSAGDVAEQLHIALQKVDGVVREVAKDDPFWHEPRQAVLQLGAMAVAAVDSVEEWTGASDEWMESATFIGGASPTGVFLGSELWQMLTEYYIRQYQAPTETSREQASLALLGLVIEQVERIDSIELEPADEWFEDQERRQPEGPEEFGR